MHGNSKASVERKAGFEKEILNDDNDEDSNEEDPQFRKMQYNGISIF